MKVLSSLLVGGPTSPLYKALIEQQLGTNFTMGTGYNGEFRDTFFSIGLTGIASAETVEVVEKSIMDALHAVEKGGFGDDEIEAKLSMLELSSKYVRTVLLELQGPPSPEILKCSHHFFISKKQMLVLRLLSAFRRTGIVEGIRLTCSTSTRHSPLLPGLTISSQNHSDINSPL